MLTADAARFRRVLRLLPMVARRRRVARWRRRARRAANHVCAPKDQARLGEIAPEIECGDTASLLERMRRGGLRLAERAAAACPAWERLWAVPARVWNALMRALSTSSFELRSSIRKVPNSR